MEEDFRRTCRTLSKGIQEAGTWVGWVRVGATVKARMVRSLGGCPGGSGVLQTEAGNPNMFSRMRKAARWEVRGGPLYRVPGNEGEGTRGCDGVGTKTSFLCARTEFQLTPESRGE